MSASATQGGHNRSAAKTAENIQPCTKQRDNNIIYYTSSDDMTEKLAIAIGRKTRQSRN